MSYLPTERPFTVKTQIGTPIVSPPAIAPVPGDVIICTTDGTANTATQSSWEYTSAGAWVQTAGSVLGASIPTPGIRTYFSANTALYKDFTTAAQVNAAAIAGYGMTPVGAGVAVGPWAGGAVNVGRTYIQVDCPGAIAGTAPLDPDVFNFPTKYIRHEVQIVPGVDNTYFLYTNQDRISTIEVWICNYATGVPELRLNGSAPTAVYAGRHTPLHCSPTSESGSDHSYFEWFGFPIPKDALISRTVGGRIKLAFRPALFNAEGARLYISGFAMSANAVNITVRTTHGIEKRVDSGGYMDNAGILDGTAYISVPANATAPTGAAGISIRVPLVDTTKDIWLNLVGLGNANGNPAQWLNTTIIHSSGNIDLGRPKPNLASPYANAYLTDVGSGHPMSGWVVTASQLAAKTIKPANSAIPYLELQFRNTNQADVAYFAGIITETLT
jgi:hypothetical protein